MNFKSFAVGEDIAYDVNLQGKECANSQAYSKEKVRLMCDAHRGASGPIGFTSTFTDKIVPATVGVDIACRVSAYNLGNEDIDFEKLDAVARRVVPTGFHVREHEANYSLDFPYEELYYWDELKNQERLRCSMGTLGGGEVCDCHRAA